MLEIDQITALFTTRGAVQYGAEAVTQQQHALQCAHLAERAGGSPQLIAAALLHDLGHLLPLSATADPAGDDLHQYRAIPFLRGSFGEAVVEPICLHVDAKRYLCRIDRTYWSSLSPASQQSLVLQGGEFSEVEAQAFIDRPYATDAVALRRWDDLAKDPQATTPDWTHFARILGNAGVSTRSAG
jgi:phosphonate degradation associated HDIG domain protein